MVKISSFNLVKEQIPVETIRGLLNIKDDELLKLFFSYMVCESASNMRLPHKQHKTEIAKALMDNGVKDKDIKEILHLNKSTLWRAKQ